MAAKLAAAMEKGLHYTVDEKQKAILITEDGYEAAEDVLQVCFATHCSNSAACSRVVLGHQHIAAEESLKGATAMACTSLLLALLHMNSTCNPAALRDRSFNISMCARLVACISA